MSFSVTSPTGGRGDDVNPDLSPALLRVNEDGEQVIDLKRALARLRAKKPLLAS